MCTIVNAWWSQKKYYGGVRFQVHRVRITPSQSVLCPHDKDLFLLNTQVGHSEVKLLIYYIIVEYQDRQNVNKNRNINFLIIMKVTGKKKLC